MSCIKEILEVKGVSQTGLANKLGKTFNMPNLYTTNKVQPPIRALYQIAELLNIDGKAFIGSNAKHPFIGNLSLPDVQVI